MKKSIVVALFSVLALTTTAQNNALDLRSQAQLRRTVLERNKHKGSAAQEVKKNLTGFVTIAPGYSAEDLEAAGFTVDRTYGNNLVTVTFPEELVDELSVNPAVKSLQLARSVKTTMDLARKDVGVDAIHNGEEGLPQKYHGSGVIAGIVDQGVDAHHVNFCYNDGSTRIEYLQYYHYNALSQPVLDDWYNSATMDRFVTDTQGTYHGTHTLGIMAGAYGGEGATITTADGEVTSQFHGCAPASTLGVICMDDILDIFIAYGIEDLYYFAQDLDPAGPMPIVVNMSLGSNVGPHDPNNAMNQILEYYGDKMIICLSAGNEGDHRIAMRKHLTAEDNKVQTFIYPFYYNPDNGYDYTYRQGELAIYCADEKPLKSMRAVIFDRSLKTPRAIYNMPIVGDNIGTYYISSDDYYVTDDDIIAPNFSKYFEGYVGVGGKLDETVNRYYYMLDYNIVNTELNSDDHCVLGLYLEGEDGQYVELYNDDSGCEMWNYDLDGYDCGTTDGTISDLAIGKNVLVVGSYATRQSWNALSGLNLWYEGDDFAPGHISSFSSYITYEDGTSLPHVCAPGSTIISSMSTPYVEYGAPSQWLSYDNLIAKTNLFGRNHYWTQSVGTSMSTPVVAGSIALWLEADPTLSIDDVKDIIAQTATCDDDVREEDAARWGAGKFNALEGLKEVLRRKGASVQGVTIDLDSEKSIMVQVNGTDVEIFNPGRDGFTANVYAMDGTCVASATTPSGDSLTIPVNRTGLFIVNVDGISNKIIIK